LARVRLWRFILMVVSVALLGCLIWRPTLSVLIDPSQIHFDGGNQYSFRVSELAYSGYRLVGDTENYPMRSVLVLLRDGMPLGPPHSPHGGLGLKLGMYGNGAYSHWERMLYFSTPQSADPRVDGHKYSIKARLSLSPRLALSLVTSLVVVAALLAVTFARSLVEFWKPEWGLVSVALKGSALGILFVAIPNLLYNQSEVLIANGEVGLLMIYLSVTLISLAALTSVPFLESSYIRAPLAIVLLAGFVTDHIIVSLYNQHISLDLMRTLWRERDMGSTVIMAYQDAILKNFAFGLLLGAAFMYAPPARWHLGPRYAMLPFGALLSVLIFTFYANGRIEIPTSAFAVPAQLAVAQMRTIGSQAGAAAAVEYTGTIQPQVRRLIMIVDESVRGDYLGLNNTKYDNTPFLDQISSKIANYGTAVSTANCSDTSRVILRLGLQQRQLPDLDGTWARLPTLWQYAHKAGFTTALIDAWQRDRPFHSYMSEGEAKNIDIKIYPDDEPAYLRDRTVADRLLELLQRDEPLFIYVNKYGIHTPYATAHEPDMNYEPPALTLLQGGNILEDYRRNVVREYHKAVKWSVDDFFAKVLPTIVQMPDTAVIYTSDHGQAMFDGGYDASHCSVNPAVAKGEFFVPLFVVTAADQLRAEFAKEARRAFNRAHHFDIFPTLLGMMGYSSQWAAAHYGSSLQNVPIDRERVGLLGTFFSPGARWIAIDGNVGKSDGSATTGYAAAH
jgi:arylsulfatase A-like enzyme